MWFSCFLSLTHEGFVALNLAEYVAPLLSYRKDGKPQERCDLVIFTYISSMCSANEHGCLPSGCTNAKVKAGSFWKLQRTDLKVLGSLFLHKGKLSSLRLIFFNLI